MQRIALVDNEQQAVAGKCERMKGSRLLGGQAAGNQCCVSAAGLDVVDGAVAAAGVTRTVPDRESCSR